MRVLIHGLAMYKRGGGSRHLEGLVQALGQLDPDSEYLLCLNSRFKFISPHPNITIYPIEIKSAFQRLWWDQVTLPRLVRERQVDSEDAARDREPRDRDNQPDHPVLVPGFVAAGVHVSSPPRGRGNDSPRRP